MEKVAYQVERSFDQDVTNFLVLYALHKSKEVIKAPVSKQWHSGVICREVIGKPM